jgi:hypothetical protein
MGNHKKTQEGVFIALFALSTLVVLGLAIGFMSNTVNDLLAGQGQVMAGKQSYWLAYSGMEITSTNRFAGITAGTNTYTLEGGEITILSRTSADKFNGSNRTNEITSTGTVADGSRQLKWTLDTPTLQAYDFALATPKLTMNAPVSIAQDAIFTISAWVYIDALSLSPLFGLSTDTDDHWIRFTDASNMAIKGTGTAVVLSHGLTVGTGSWQHIVITRGSSPLEHTVTVYVNGVAGSNPVVWNEQFLPNAIGTDFAGEARHYFDGRIAQVAIWNTTLSVFQIRSIYIQGLSFDIRTTADNALPTNLDDNLVHYWVLNGGVSDSEGSNTLAPSASCTATGI